jgi:hypothetical protein
MTQGKGKFQLEISPGLKFGLNGSEDDYTARGGVTFRV